MLHLLLKYTKLSDEEREKLQQEIAEDEQKEEEKECCPPLTDLPDKDAAILCELVYESGLLNHIINEPTLSDLSLGQAIYKDGKLKAEIKALLSKDDKDGSPTKGVLNMPLDNYASYYQPILAKYKLVAISPSNSVDYFGIAIAKECDSKNKGIYVINRGTDTPENWITDARMALQHLIPMNTLTFCTKAGIKFAEGIIDDNVEHVGFAGHSLGGSITQAQTVYFSSYKVNLSPSKTFEGYGIKGFMDGVGNFDCIKNSYGFNMVVSCSAELAHDVIKMPISALTLFTDSAMEKQVKDNYDKL